MVKSSRRYQGNKKILITLSNFFCQQIYVGTDLLGPFERTNAHFYLDNRNNMCINLNPLHFLLSSHYSRAHLLIAFLKKQKKSNEWEVLQVVFLI